MNATAGVTLALLVLSTAIHTAQGTAVPDSNIVRLKVVNDPTVAFRIWFRVGSQDDPAGKEGLALLTASMVGDASTKKNSYEQILQKLYPLAAGYSASAGTEMTIVSGRVHKDNLTEYYPLFVDAMLEPAFAQQDLDRITRAESSPAEIVAAAKPLLAKLVQQPDCLQAQYKKRGASAYGRYMLHRAPRFNITAIVWGPGDNAKAHNHDT